MINYQVQAFLQLRSPKWYSNMQPPQHRKAADLSRYVAASVGAVGLHCLRALKSRNLEMLAVTVRNSLMSREHAHCSLSGDRQIGRIQMGLRGNEPMKHCYETFGSFARIQSHQA